MGRRPRTGILLVTAVALVGALAGARQMVASTPAADPAPTPDVATAGPSLRARVVPFEELPQGEPARLPAYIARDLSVGLAYVDAAGRVPLPGALGANILGTWPSGTLLMVRTSDPAGGQPLGYQRLLRLGPDRRLQTVLSLDAAGAWVSPDGGHVVVLREDPEASRTAGVARPMAVIVNTVDGRTVANRTVSSITGVGWLGDRLALSLASVVLTWRADEGWRDHPLPDISGRALAAGDALLVPRLSGSGAPDCLWRWTLAGGLPDRPLWCAGGSRAMPWSVSPSGGRVLIFFQPGEGGLASDYSWGSLEVATGRLTPLDQPANVFPLTSPLGDATVWEDDGHALFGDRSGGFGSRDGVRCDATNGRCETAALPADLAR